ncbi:MAG TPA: hypothetical protein VFS48_07135, partial [Solirubrobacterales bacterium]|nr:hypothetical protein [Solirubrobacterales bacterium]
DGMNLQRKLLERIPSQISGLEIKLEEAEAAGEENEMRLLGEVFEESNQKHWGLERERERQRHEKRMSKSEPTLQQPWEHPVGGSPKPKRPWHENPWLTGIGVTVVGGLILALLVYGASQVF